MADESSLAPPTLFSDAKLAELEARAHAVLTAAGQIVAVVHDAWHLVQEIKQARAREQYLHAAAQQHATAGQQALAFAQQQQDRVTEIAATANEHYGARQKLEADNAALAAEVDRLRTELANAAQSPKCSVCGCDPLPVASGTDLGSGTLDDPVRLPMGTPGVAFVSAVASEESTPAEVKE